MNRPILMWVTHLILHNFLQHAIETLLILVLLKWHDLEDACLD